MIRASMFLFRESVDDSRMISSCFHFSPGAQNIIIAGVEGEVRTPLAVAAALSFPFCYVQCMGHCFQCRTLYAWKKRFFRDGGPCTYSLAKNDFGMEKSLLKDVFARFSIRLVIIPRVFTRLLVKSYDHGSTKTWPLKEVLKIVPSK